MPDYLVVAGRGACHRVKAASDEEAAVKVAAKHFPSAEYVFVYELESPRRFAVETEVAVTGVRSAPQ